MEVDIYELKRRLVRSSQKILNPVSLNRGGDRDREIAMEMER